MIVIRSTSPGPSLFAQTRLGRSRREFTLYKLRTMQQGTTALPTHLADPSTITTFGRTLRRWKIDELPQLWNVIRGDMSLVGPRPCLPTQIALIDARQKSGAFNVRPGITGLAQVLGIDMSRPDVLAEIDGHYAHTRTLRRDMIILFQTLSGRGLRQDPMTHHPQ